MISVRQTIYSLATLSMTATVAFAAAPPTPLAAELILSGGEIYTPAGWAQAMAVRRGVIIAVGDQAAVDAHKTAQTQTINLNGATVLPGLHDMHVHPSGAGMQENQCRFPQGTPGPKVIDAVKACVAKRQKDEWIVGGQWDAASFGNQPPHRSQLDRVSPDNPVALVDISGHSTWANSKALQLAGITAQTANPAGGIIEKDAKGEPTGVLRESAAGLVRRHVPPPTLAQNIKALEWSLQRMLSHGITSFTDAGVSEDSMQAYAALADQGKLKQRVRGCIMWRPVVFSAADAAQSSPVERRNLYARDRFSPDCIKMVLDGVPTDGHTAAMVEPYADAKDPKDPRAKGILMVPQSVLDKAVTEFDAQGLTVKFHAAGDAAVRAGLDAIAAARKANGLTGPLHDVGHVSFAQLNDVGRGRAIAATYEMSPYIWYPNPIIPDIAKAIGPERMKRWIPVKEVLAGGSLVVPGSDWPVVPEVNPWVGIETLVTRQGLGGGGEVLGEVEKITLQQAIDMFTVNSARQMGNRDRTGRIERGLLADVIVVDRNPFKVAATQVHDTKVRMTIINGEVVYRAPD
jgi:predicted amidohydrolase YtcJ